MKHPTSITEACRELYDDKKIDKKSMYEVLRNRAEYKRLLFKEAIKRYLEEIDKYNDVFGESFAEDGLLEAAEKIFS